MREKSFSFLSLFFLFGVFWGAFLSLNCGNLNIVSGESKTCLGDSDCPAGQVCVKGLCSIGGTSSDGSASKVDGGGGTLGEGGASSDGGDDTGGGEGVGDGSGGGKCKEGQVRSCYSGPKGTANIGECAEGQQLCFDGKWENCVGERLPKAEKCDGKDNDCDGIVDEGCGCVPGSVEKCYTGPAGTEGKGICKAGKRVCQSNKTWGPCTGQQLPGSEVCNGVDDNCDGRVDEGCAKCKPGERKKCYSGPDWSRNKGICKEGYKVCQSNGIWGKCQGEVLPNIELCDKKDNDCDGKVDDNCYDCIPGSKRPCYPPNMKGCTLVNGKMSCKGICKPGVSVCNSAGKWGACQNPVIPKPETCNGKDDDCDGQVDEGLTPRPCHLQKGVCAGSKQRCVNGVWKPCDLNDYKRHSPDFELNEKKCDGKDNNCNGAVDEFCTCKSGAKRKCYTGPFGTEGKGPCRGGVQTCTAGKWGPCVGEVIPKLEICNGVDDDCNGKVDETFPEMSKTCKTSLPHPCNIGKYTCVNGKLSCEPYYKPQKEICNGKDDDCDGQIDEGAPKYTFYRDADGDGYGDPKVTIKACVPPPGYVKNNDDCYDKNSKVHPNQRMFFSQHRGDGSFDYNCDGKEQKRYTKLGSCKNCQTPYIDIGFVAPIPDCGKVGRWLDKCRFDVGKCLDVTIPKVQECR